MLFDFAVCVTFLLVAACGQTSGSSSSCVSNVTCVPTTAPNVCSAYRTACDASGIQSCAAIPVADGTSCGSGQVCFSGGCIAPCVAGQACSPSAADVCKTYSTSCSAELSTTTCVAGGNQPDGTPCGAGHVCSVGICVATCNAGLACSPVGIADPCKIYTYTCSSDGAQQFCQPSANRPDGTACGNSQTCQSGACQGAVAVPTLTPPGATAPPGLIVALSHPVSTAEIFYTTDGSAPSDAPETLTQSFVGGGTIVLQSTAMVQAFAKVGTQRSASVVGIYTIVAPPPPPPLPPDPIINLSSGFTADKVQMNGSATLDNAHLQLTDSGTPSQFGSGFFPSAVNIQAFTTDFSFQVTVDDPLIAGDGLTFTVQGSGPFAVGSQGGGLGYGPNPFEFGQQLKIPQSVAIKFDIFDNNGEGRNSTGIYTNGQTPTLPSLDLTPSGIHIASGRVLNVHMVYDGALLTMTVSDASTTPVAKFTTTWPVSIPLHVGGPTGWVGFTGSTGGLTSRIRVLNWTYTNVK